MLSVYLLLSVFLNMFTNSLLVSFPPSTLFYNSETSVQNNAQGLFLELIKKKRIKKEHSFKKQSLIQT